MIRIETRGDGVAIVWLDHSEKAVNTLSPGVVDEFRATVLPLFDDPAVRALVVASAKADTFIAGADLEIIEGLDEAQISQMSRDGNALLEAIHTGPKPVVAAVHGAAIGGGMEVALACHYILASDDPRTVFSQAEVMLGLLPAGGGTQRLVERVGLVAALPLLLTGARVRARKAKRMGIVDALTTPGGIAETGARAALALAEGRLARPKRRRSLVDRLSALPPVRAKILGEAAKQVRRRTRGLYPAPPAILDCVETGLKKGRLAGLERESFYFGRLAAGVESRNLVRLFHAMNRAKKPAEGSAPKRVDRLAVLGAGFMGAGVASVSLGHLQVVLKDISDASLGAGLLAVEKGLEAQVRSGAITRREADRRRSALLPTTDDADLAGADLVIEAVFEDLELKRRVLADAEARIAPDAVFASNTSALPIARIAEGARHPERVLGMHYFSPVPKMPLLEIVVAERTAEWATATARAIGTAQGKTCIVVKDGPGFYTTRILAPYLNEAAVLLAEGARVEDLDRVMKDFGYPVGPVALIDEVGIDVGAHVAADLGAAFADRGLGASDALPTMFEAGFQGRKNGRGFYLYPKTRRKGPKSVNPEVYRFFGGPQRRTVAVEEIRDRMAMLMVNEAVWCLDEGVIASPEDGDLGAILGLGFPPFRGGPFRFVDHEGAQTIVDRMKALADRHGPRFNPAPGLTELAGSGGRFYPEA
ncbi:MAG: 3-hydroxyacyl-CoA dehydrogenase NAD-binding domain-containing protein [Thermoanaerobaculales bacterium]|jgi:3-hydroxyacyl-CoA dehydrogenase/enoyl-CoA hydratase/3-hydroxybutyryl-CoA epimerase|nr:3-hydroxyacyl-CoA dehydrogenase NAD-binding domain-containing protein [Thermoanaerobaculales bacterium]